MLIGKEEVMHKWSYETMEWALRGADAPPGGRVLDVGSYDVNGSFRPIAESLGLQYLGLDVLSGKNVDVVSEDPYRFPFEDGEFDVVISGSTMEHVEDIFAWFDEVVRVLRPEGTLIITTHTSWKYHPHPIDCWRIMSDGMRYLVNRNGHLKDVVIQSTDTDILLCCKKE